MRDDMHVNIERLKLLPSLCKDSRRVSKIFRNGCPILSVILHFHHIMNFMPDGMQIKTPKG